MGAVSDINVLIRRYYEDKISREEFEQSLSQQPSEDLAVYLSDMVNRVSAAMNFALTFTYGYEDV